MQSLSTPLDPPGRIAMVGAGGFGRFCIGAYRQAGDIDTVTAIDPDPDALAAIDDPTIQLGTEWHAMVADPAIEVVHVATPPHMREAIITAAFGAGKSVFCEKPIALTLPEADGMIETARQAHVTLGVNYVMRHLPAYTILQRLAVSGILGPLRTIAFENFAQTVPPGHWFWNQEQSGGILVEHGVHFFDAYGRVAGLPTEAWSTVPRPGAIEAWVRYDSGVVARYFHEFAYPRQIERTSGVSAFERGIAVIDGWIPTRVHVSALSERASLEAAAGVPADAAGTTESGATWLEWVFQDRQASYAHAISAGMRDVIRRHRDPGHHMAVDATDARESLALAVLAREVRKPWLID